ncbi:bifunctional riboflavin kinase/FAD synthetase [Micrococcales bacterium 31B]|nr:bifunctional riboflavin kinase/FAD synthetase [Micrococcales bacterium 31B]
MQLWKCLGGVPFGFGPSVVTIGNFDGVHLGHREVLGSIVETARSTDMKAVAVTFKPHPLAVLRPQSAPDQITSFEDKVKLLNSTGIDALLVERFDLNLAQLSPEDFVRRYFVEYLGAREVVVGRDVRFGHKNVGDISTMMALGEKYDFAVVPLDDVTGTAVGAGHETALQPRRWSSTWVREALAAGDVETAAKVLGRPHRVSGEVVHGFKRGRDLGFPTANLQSKPDGMVPRDGVYAGLLTVEPHSGDAPGFSDALTSEEAKAITVPAASETAEPQRWLAAISVGTNPTFQGVARTVEAYVLDGQGVSEADLDLYGKYVRLEFVAQIRPMLKFSGLDELIDRMRRDVTESRDVLTRFLSAQ